MENTNIRLLTRADIPAADALLSLAFGRRVNRTADLELHLKIGPQDWFVIENDGQLAGMVGAGRYGTRAHVGFMGVHPAFQRRGFGTALMNCLLTELERKGVTLITLDASPDGQALYEKLGFSGHYRTVNWTRSGHTPGSARQASEIAPLHVEGLVELVKWDLPYFGASRKVVFQHLLETYPWRAFSARGRRGLAGYIFAQPGRIGPWAAVETGVAQDLLAAALTLAFNDATIISAVPEENEAAARLLLEHGFAPERNNLRMMLGAGPAAEQRALIYAQTSLALG